MCKRTAASTRVCVYITSIVVYHWTHNEIKCSLKAENNPRKQSWCSGGIIIIVVAVVTIIIIAITIVILTTTFFKSFCKDRIHL